MTPTSTQTAVNANMRELLVRRAATRLLDRLKSWVRVYPLNEADAMPDHDIVFATGVDDGPAQVICDAMRATPALWLGALPDDIVLVRKSRLVSHGLPMDLIEWWRGEAANMIELESHKMMIVDDFPERKP